LLLVLYFILFFLYRSEKPKTFYPTLADAIKDGAIERGWIPPILPPSSRKITEQHDIDTNIGWIKFTADSADLKILLLRLRVLTNQEIDMLFPLRSPGKWWDIKKESRNSLSFAAYDYKISWANGRTEDKVGYFFIDEKNSIGYYYSGH
jgi:hypothetical protein